MSQSNRIAAGGRVDRDRPVDFVFDGVTYTGYAGDTLASALLANGVRTVTTSVNLGRPRGISGSWAEDATAQVGIDAPFIEPMVPATTVELCPGLVAHGVPGWGRLSTEPDTARYDRLHHHPDVLVVGAGAAGLMAALICARAGVSVLLVDERNEPGGSTPGASWVAAAVAEFDAFERTTRLIRTTAFGGYDDGFVLAVEHRTDHLGDQAPAHVSRQRLHRIRARHIIIAAGAHERPIVFADNDLPGVMLAGSAADYVCRYGVRPGSTAVVYTACDSAYEAAFALSGAGTTISAIVDTRDEVASDLLDEARKLRIPVHPGGYVVRALGASTHQTLRDASPNGSAPQGSRGTTTTDKPHKTRNTTTTNEPHESRNTTTTDKPHKTRNTTTTNEPHESWVTTDEYAATFLIPEAEATKERGSRRVRRPEAHEVIGAEISAPGLDTGTVIDCDTILVSGGWNPAAHLWSQLRGTIAFDETAAAFLPVGSLTNVEIVGAAAGLLTESGCLTDGRRGALTALRKMGIPLPEFRDVPKTPERTPAATAICWRSPGDPSTATTSFVDLQRDATVADIARAIGAGMRSVEHVKRYTTIGTAHDQGKTSGIVSSGIVAELLGVPVADTGTTTFRPPYTPVSFAVLAGRDRGDLYDPVRRTPIHDWHVESGAVFEDVGQWKRPRFYPRVGEDMDAAVLRECAAVRSGVGILDGSTLGLIEVAGLDAPAFMDMLYTNLMSTLKPGKIRYGVMCGADGMVIDDGTVMRLADDRYWVYTTTGNAASILDWMQEWQQTEWPQLRVFSTSLTDHMATFPVVGPRSREVIGAVFGELDVANDAFAFMDWRDTTFRGVPVRVGRVSFSGELAFEVNVPAGYARAVWDALIKAGTSYGITPYGTEAMHVLRAEKGYPIIGQDTDGTVTPHDLGLGWAVSKRKPDFIGKRSYARQSNLDPNRKQLVGLLPVDATTRLPEGSQVIDHNPDRVVPPAPVPMLGHVTSSYDSAELGRPFALALVGGGTGRIGTRLDVPVGDRLVEVEVTSPVFVDPEGARRDG